MSEDYERYCLHKEAGFKINEDELEETESSVLLEYIAWLEDRVLTLRSYFFED